MKSDPQEIARTLAVLFQPGDVVELRVPKPGASDTVSGYFNDFAKLQSAIADQNGSGIYLTLNTCNPALLARACNRIVRAKKTTSDKDITCRRWLLVDFDPVRPADISSSNAEHEAALERARDVRCILTEESGWPAPIYADSGNGGHLLYRIECGNDEVSTDLLRRVLRALKARFGDAVVAVDESVYNAARITKAYGTVARKGDDTAERPHRLSRIVESPRVVEPVTREQLVELAAAAEPEPVRTAPITPCAPFSVEKWIADCHLSVRPPVAHDRGRKWVLDACPFDEEHRAPDAAIFEGPDGRPGFKCLHDSCAGYHWRELRELIEGPRPRSSRNDRPRVEPPRVLACADVLALESVSEKTLFDEYPLPASGLTLKVGAARSGKTVLAVQESIALARNRPLFDYYRVLEPGPTMIVEQDDPGGASAIKTMLVRGNVASDAPFYVVPNLPFGFGDALLEWLEEQITKLSLRMVVLDSYTALRGSRGAGIDIVKAEQIELSRIDALAKRLGRSIQIIHHGSKGAADLDWTLAAAGTYVMAASSEAQTHMSRFNDLDTGATERLLRIRGRHSADAQVVLRFRKETLDFEFLVQGSAAEHYPVIRQIHAEIGSGATFGPKELSEALGLARATAFRLISRLRSANVIQKASYGHYQLVGDLRLLQI